MPGWKHLSPAQVADATHAGGLAKAAAEVARAKEIRRRYNLPLTPKEIQLCVSLVLLGRPVTLREWLAAAGCRESKGPTRLVRGGWVAMFRGKESRRGSWSRYVPTAKLLDALAAAPSP